ncbi:MAG: signal peptidase II [Ignavibacteria bacterium]|nr:signal peptidase II [Ignavibacteria bacterium]
MKVLFLTFFIVIIDQITKLYVKGISIPMLGIEIPGMPYQSSIKVFGDFFKITFIENPGMAFGLQIGGKLFLSLFTIFATGLLFIFLYKNRKETLLLRLALAFILGGAVGNLIDRVFYGKIYGYAPYFYGKVVDFLHFDFPNFTIFGKTIYSWPIFNVADISVSLGFIMILIGYKKIFHSDENTEIQPSGDNTFPADNSFTDLQDPLHRDDIDRLKPDPGAPEITQSYDNNDISGFKNIELKAAEEHDIPEKINIPETGKENQSDNPLFEKKSE